MITIYTYRHQHAIKGYCNRKVALMENGSWAPSAGKSMRAMLEGMKGIEILPDTVTIRGSFKEADRPSIDALAQSILNA